MTIRRPAALVAGLGLVAGGLAAGITPASANPDGTDLVISEVYGGGGNSGATYTHDFVELYNPTDAPISVTGLTLTYYSASSGNAGGSHGLEGSVDPGEHFLVQESSNAAVGDPLPDSDDEGSLQMGGSAGAVELTRGSTVVDLVGYGTGTNQRSETAPAGSLSSTTSASRDAEGSDDDDNASDFTVGAPSPTNAAGEGPGGEEPPGEVEAKIAEIQGTGDESPLVGDTVTTSGVVTAAYPTGGLFGFYLQTDGTGGELDLATHEASDGVFVRQTQPAGPVTVQEGDAVEVTGTVTEFAGQTQVEVASAADIVASTTEPAGVTPVVSAWPATDEEKESLEGMLFAPQGDFTVTDNYGTNSFGELVLARGDEPLIQPTEVARPNSARALAVAADNEARRILLDDASSTRFGPGYNTTATPPYISNTQPFRIGATSDFDEPVVLTEGGSPSAPSYRLQPLQPVVGPANAESPYVVPDTRTPAPDAAQIAADGRPAVKVASFNVLNYFTTLGDADDDNVGNGGCTAFTDRDGDGNNVRGGCDQRGAWDPQDFRRQQAKIVRAINSLDADVVGLMEIENSAVLGEEPDEAVESLVAALNRARPNTWAANPSSDELPPTDQMDVITNAIIYKPSAVRRVGESRALGDLSEGDDSVTDEPFANAREPLGQAFRPRGGGEPVLVVVNHFKSKGSAGPFPGDEDSGDGQGSANESRTRQAEALVDWVEEIQGDVDDVLLLGDFNSYTQEDPMRILYSAGYTNLGNDGDYSYSFGGQSGSLDHVVANAGALERVTGSDVWNINAVEALPMEYSRFNYHGTDFHTDGPWRSSDHDPVVVGMTRGTTTPATPTMKVRVEPRRVVAKRTKPRVIVRMDGEEGPVTGQVRVRWRGQVRSAELVRERARVVLPKIRKPGRVQLRVVYTGDDTYQRVVTTRSFRVRPRG